MLYGANDLIDLWERKIFAFSIFDISRHRKAINIKNTVLPLKRTARFTALKWDVYQCCKTNTFKIIVINVKNLKNFNIYNYNQNSKIWGRHAKFYFDLGPKRYLGQRDPIIGSMGYGGTKLNEGYGLLSRKWVYSVY